MAPLTPAHINSPPPPPTNPGRADMHLLSVCSLNHRRHVYVHGLGQDCIVACVACRVLPLLSEYRIVGPRGVLWGQAVPLGYLPPPPPSGGELRT